MLIVKIGMREVKSKRVQASSANELNPCQSPVERNRSISAFRPPALSKHSLAKSSLHTTWVAQGLPLDISFVFRYHTNNSQRSVKVSSLRSKKLVINVIEFPVRVNKPRPSRKCATGFHHANSRLHSFQHQVIPGNFWTPLAWPYSLVPHMSSNREPKRMKVQCQSFCSSRQAQYTWCIRRHLRLSRNDR